MLQNALGIRHAAIPVRDLKRAVSFYVDTLGFTPYLITDNDWAMVRLHGTTLSLVPYHEESTSRPKTHPAHIGVVFARREDVDAFHRELSTKKIPWMGKCEEHRDKSYGFYLKDTEENHLEFIFIPMAPVETVESGEGVLVVVPEKAEKLETLLRLHIGQKKIWVAEAASAGDVAVDCNVVRIVPLFVAKLNAIVARLQKKHPKTRFIVDKNLQSQPLFYSLICESVLTLFDN